MTEHNKVTWWIASRAMRDLTELCGASLTYDPNDGAPHNKVTWYLLYYADRSTAEYFGATLVSDRHTNTRVVITNSFRVRINDAGVDLLYGSLDAFDEWCVMCVLSDADMASCTLGEYPPNYIQPGTITTSLITYSGQFPIVSP